MPSQTRQPLTTTNQVLETIRARRRALHLTQQQVAEKLGTSQVHLSDIENGRRGLDVDRLLSLLNVLGLELVLQDKAIKTKVEW
jgi:transcriptional regulator with XRE-family HTH domain